MPRTLSNSEITLRLPTEEFGLVQGWHDAPICYGEMEFRKDHDGLDGFQCQVCLGFAGQEQLNDHPTLLAHREEKEELKDEEFEDFEEWSEEREWYAQRYWISRKELNERIRKGEIKGLEIPKQIEFTNGTKITFAPMKCACGQEQHSVAGQILDGGLSFRCYDCILAKPEPEPGYVDFRPAPQRSTHEPMSPPACGMRGQRLG